MRTSHHHCGSVDILLPGTHAHQDVTKCFITGQKEAEGSLAVKIFIAGHSASG
jgi:hypothetical protein